MTSATDEQATQALSDAWSAVSLMHSTLELDRFGEMDGAETLEIGLAALAPPLAFLVGVSSAAGEEFVRLLDVLALLEARSLLPKGTTTQTEDLFELLRQANYVGLDRMAAGRAETLRSSIVGALTQLLDEVVDWHGRHER